MIFYHKGTSTNGHNTDDFCCILCGYKEQSVERLKDHINLHFISQMKRPMPSKSSPSPSKSGSESNESPSSSESGHNDDSGGEPPRPKRIKTEPATSSPRHEGSTNEQRSIRNESGASKESLQLASSSLSHSDSGLRCQSCDIGFSHLSNLLAHKKFYCRGMQASKNADQNASN